MCHKALLAGGLIQTKLLAELADSEFRSQSPFSGRSDSDLTPEVYFCCRQESQSPFSGRSDSDEAARLLEEARIRRSQSPFSGRSDSDAGGSWFVETAQRHKALLAGGLIQTRDRGVDRVAVSSHKALLAGGLIQTLGEALPMRLRQVTKPF